MNLESMYMFIYLTKLYNILLYVACAGCSPTFIACLSIDFDIAKHVVVM